MIRVTEQNINTPDAYDEKFNGTLGAHDMVRFERLAKYFKGGTYVDIGCFDSPMPALLAERYASEPGKNMIYAFDHAPKMIAFLAARFPKVLYNLANCYDIPLADESVDYVVAGELIEHLEEPAKAIAEWMRILKPGGYLAISTPLEEPDRQMGGEYHLWKWSKEDIDTLLDNPETEVMEEKAGTQTILAWKKK